MYCSYCGEQIVVADARYCSKCGKQVPTPPEESAHTIPTSELPQDSESSVVQRAPTPQTTADGLLFQMPKVTLGETAAPLPVSPSVQPAHTSNTSSSTKEEPLKHTTVPTTDQDQIAPTPIDTPFIPTASTEAHKGAILIDESAVASEIRAPFRQRGKAFVLDALWLDAILCLLTWIGVQVFGKNLPHIEWTPLLASTAVVLGCILNFMIGCVYFVICEVFLFGSSLGKRLMGIHVQDDNGAASISLEQSVARNLSKPLDVFMLLPGVKNRLNNTLLHDLIGGTRVMTITHAPVAEVDLEFRPRAKF